MAVRRPPGVSKWSAAWGAVSILELRPCTDTTTQIRASAKTHLHCSDVKAPAEFDDRSRWCLRQSIEERSRGSYDSDLDVVALALQVLDQRFRRSLAITQGGVKYKVLSFGDSSFQQLCSPSASICMRPSRPCIWIFASKVAYPRMKPAKFVRINGDDIAAELELGCPGEAAFAGARLPSQNHSSRSLLRRSQVQVESRNNRISEDTGMFLIRQHIARTIHLSTSLCLFEKLPKRLIAYPELLQANLGDQAEL